MWCEEKFDETDLFLEVQSKITWFRKDITNLTFFIGAAPDGSILLSMTPPRKAPWHYDALVKSAMPLATWPSGAHMSESMTPSRTAPWYEA